MVASLGPTTVGPQDACLSKEQGGGCVPSLLWARDLPHSYGPRNEGSGDTSGELGVSGGHASQAPWPSEAKQCC